MKRSVIDGGSMDMLLDTMCNTFGGVCFIALMVVLISSAMPKSKDEQSELDRVRQAEITTREVARLVQRRDMLKTALDLETEFVNANATGIVTRADMEKMLADVATSGDKIAAYEKKRVEYLDELAKLKTKDQYSKREAARLERLHVDGGNFTLGLEYGHTCTGSGIGLHKILHYLRLRSDGVTVKGIGAGADCSLGNSLVAFHKSHFSLFHNYSSTFTL